MRYVVGLQVDYNGCTFLQDGLWFVHLQPELIAGYTNCAITPNAVEFDRLCVACNVHEHTAHALAHGLRGVTVVRKAAVDHISDATIGMSRAVIPVCK
jgi:ATP-dependent NAD(P)H-hydrate dehydratase